MTSPTPPRAAPAGIPGTRIDPALHPATGDGGPARSPTLFGREQDLAGLDLVLDRVLATRMPEIVMIIGAAGAGTSALLAAFADLASRRGVVADPSAVPARPADSSGAEEPVTLLLLDDAQHAATGRLEDVLSRVRAGHPLVAALGLRRDEPWRSGAALEEVRRFTRTTVIQPRPLGVQAVGALLQREFATAPHPDVTLACHRATRGNPYLVTEVAQDLIGQGLGPHAEHADAVERSAPATVGDSFAALIDRTDPSAVTVVSAVALIGESLTSAELGSLTQLPQPVIEQSLRVLAGSGLLRARDNTLNHPVIGRSLAARIPVAERERLHEAAALLLADRGATLERVARHLLSGPYRLGANAAGLIPTLADQALARGEIGLARDVVERGLVASFSPGRRAVLSLTLGSILHELGDGRGIEHCRHAVEVLPPGDTRLEAIAELVSATADLEGPVPARDLVVRLTGSLDTSDEERLLTELDAVLTTLADPTSTERGHDTPLGRALHGDGREDCVAQATRILTSSAGPRMPGIRHTAALVALVHAGRAADADHSLSRLTDRAASSAELSLLSARVALRLGDVERARAESRRARDLVNHGRPAPLLGSAAALLALAHIEAGQAAEAVAALADVRDESPPDRSELPGLELDLARGHTAMAVGDAAAAVATLIRCGERAQALGIDNPAVLPWRTALAHALHAVGQGAEASRQGEESSARARRWGAPFAIAEALLAQATVTDDHGVRLGLLRAATETVDDATDAPLTVARTRVALGAELLSLSTIDGSVIGSAELDEARELLRDGGDRAQRLGATALADRAHGLLVASGARPRRRERVGLASLTRHQEQVAELAARGRTNREIADDLFVTQRTVEMHLTQVFRKLGITRRADLRGFLGDAPD